MIDFLVYTIFTLLTANACSFFEGNNWAQIVVLIILMILYYFRNCRIDNNILLVIGVWCVINTISYWLNRGGDFDMFTFLSVTTRMLFSYLMLKIVGVNFFKGLFNYWFALSVLGFPFFIVESLFPSFIQSLAPVLNFMTQAEQKESGGFYLFFYMHSGWAQFMGEIVRNCGFMWEPGAFGCVLTFMIVYRLFDNNFKIDKKVLFLIICLLSTFSTSGYLALFVIALFYFIKNPSFYRRYNAMLPILILAIAIAGYMFYQSTDFMSGKIDKYEEMGTKSWNRSYGEYHVTRVSRLGIFILALDNSVYSPWGDGVITSNYLMEKGNPQGPNSWAQILLQWGWLGVIVLIYSLYNFRIKGQRCGLILLIPLSFPLFSNPFAFRTLIYAIVFSVLCVHEVQDDVEEEKHMATSL